LRNLSDPSIWRNLVDSILPLPRSHAVIFPPVVEFEKLFIVSRSRAGDGLQRRMGMSEEAWVGIGRIATQALRKILQTDMIDA
jgi:hypothetical protein